MRQGAERYDLISAAVIDAKGKLMGRLTIEEIVDVVNEESDTTLRRMGVKPGRGCVLPGRPCGADPLVMAGDQSLYCIYRLQSYWFI